MNVCARIGRPAHAARRNAGAGRTAPCAVHCEGGLRRSHTPLALSGGCVSHLTFEQAPRCRRIVTSQPHRTRPLTVTNPHPRREPLNTPALPSQPANASRRFSGRMVLLVLVVAAAAFFVGRQDWVSQSLSFTDKIDGSGVA